MKLLPHHVHKLRLKPKPELILVGDYASPPAASARLWRLEDQLDSLALPTELAHNSDHACGLAASAERSVYSLSSYSPNSRHRRDKKGLARRGV